MTRRDETPLARYKRLHGFTWPQVAQLLDIQENYARKLGCGLAPRPSPELAVQIEKKSNGEISKEELIFGSAA